MSHELDQTIAFAEENLTKIVQEWRESLERKKERHGNKFDHNKAVTHLFDMLAKAPNVSAVAALAIDRLASMPDPMLPDELAALDFDFDPDKETE